MAITVARCLRARGEPRGQAPRRPCAARSARRCWRRSWWRPASSWPVESRRPRRRTISRPRSPDSAGRSTRSRGRGEAELQRQFPAAIAIPIHRVRTGNAAHRHQQRQLRQHAQSFRCPPEGRPPHRPAKQSARPASFRLCRARGHRLCPGHRGQPLAAELPTSPRGCRPSSDGSSSRGPSARSRPAPIRSACRRASGGPTANTLSTAQGRLSPYIEHDFDGRTRFRLRSDNTWTEDDASQASLASPSAAGYFGFHTFSLEREPVPFGARLEAERSDTHYDEQPSGRSHPRRRPADPPLWAHRRFARGPARRL